MVNEIFISYSRKNFEQVTAIKRAIDFELGVDCWMDLTGITSGDQFTKVIIEAINSHQIMLFMLSAESMRSEYALRELSFAKHKGKRIVLLKLDQAPMTDAFFFDYHDVDIIDFSNSLQRNKLMRDLRTWLNIKEHTTPVTPRSQATSKPQPMVRPQFRPQSTATYLWNKPSILKQTLGTHPELVTTLAFSPDGCCLASGSKGKLCIWDAKTYRQVAQLHFNSDIKMITFNSDGKHILVFEEEEVIERFLFSKTKKTIFKTTIWDWNKGICLKTFQGYDHGVFSPDGKYLAMQEGKMHIELLNANTYKREKRLESKNELLVHEKCFSKDGHLLYTFGYPTSPQLWDINRAEVVRTFRNLPFCSIASINPNRKHMLIALYAEFVLSEQFCVADMQSGEIIFNLQVPKLKIKNEGWKRTMMYNHDGSVIIGSLSEEKIGVWSAENGMLIKSFNTKELNSVVVNNDSTIVASSEGNSIVLWT